MDLQVIKVAERRDASRYVIKGSVDAASMWAFRALNVLVRLGGMTTNQALAELDKADLEYDARYGCCPWV